MIKVVGFSFDKNNQDNTTICDDLFEAGRRTLSVQDYMLQNKADVAFELLDKKADDIVPPSYIREAVEWVIN